MRRWYAGLAAATLAAPWLAMAQTVITPDTAPDLSTATIVQGQGGVTLIDGGVLRGGNLFHSFSQFDLATGDIARWTAANPASIANVVNRVTGGTPSFIAGTIDTLDLPRANFYFVNPAGIVFGSTASVDVAGAAHFSTADELRFANGDVLMAATGNGSTFSIADPASFGFLGNNAGISFEMAFLEGDRSSALAFRDLHLTAGTIRSSAVAMVGGSLSLRAVGYAPATVTIGKWDGPVPGDGTIDLMGGTIETFDDAGIRIEAGTVRLGEFATINATARQIGGQPAIAIRAGRIDIASGTIGTTGRIGFDENAGDIELDAREIFVGGTIQTVGLAEGGGGTIRIRADTLDIVGGTVEARGVAAPGRSVGDVEIDAGQVRMADFGSIITNLSDLFDENGRIEQPLGTTGNIRLRVGTLTMDTTATILAENQSDFASGPGSISIRADTVRIGQGRISTRTETAVAGGPIEIDVSGELALTGFGGIQALSQGRGNAGAITIRAGSIRMVNNGFGGPLITTVTEIPRPQEIDDISEFTGSAGRIFVETGSLLMDGFSAISSASDSFGDAGDIIINAGEITLLNGASISSAAARLQIVNATQDGFDLVPGPGRAGTITIDAGRSLRLDGSEISTATEGFGAAGAIALRADTIALANGAMVRSDASAFAPATSGSVRIDAGALSVSAGASIATSSANERNAGDITVGADTILLAGAGSQITSANLSASGGDAGSIILTADRISVVSGASLTTNSLAGAAGRIDLLLPADGILTVAGGSTPGIITTSSGPGTGGRITIARPYAIIANGARIEALGQQRGANVQLATDFFIRSADAANLLLVDGDLVVDSQVGSVSSGIDVPDISFGDAGAVLAGQCSAARTTGTTSSLAIVRTGPLALPEGEGASPMGCR